MTSSVLFLPILVLDTAGWTRKARASPPDWVRAMDTRFALGDNEHNSILIALTGPAPVVGPCGTGTLFTGYATTRSASRRARKALPDPGDFVQVGEIGKIVMSTSPAVRPTMYSDSDH